MGGGLKPVRRVLALLALLIAAAMALLFVGSNAHHQAVLLARRWLAGRDRDLLARQQVEACLSVIRRPAT